MSMKFIYQFEELSPKIEVTLDLDRTLPEVLEAFENFLLACGYKFDGVLDIVEDVNPLIQNGETNEN
jgi:hypothetical protein